VPSLHCDARVRAICGDALELTPEALRALQPRGFSAVLSDMCPATTGSGSLDATRSAVLAEAAVELALGDFGVAAADRDEENAAGRAFSQGVLLQGGALVVKLLEGDGGTRQELNAICRARCKRAMLVFQRLAHAPLRAAQFCTGCVDAAQGNEIHFARGVSRGAGQAAQTQGHVIAAINLRQGGPTAGAQQQTLSSCLLLPRLLPLAQLQPRGALRPAPARQ